ncbi:bifunctional 5-methylaminomethyl-2-thiouridine-forming enzyme methyltransferase/FAD-dependent demodification enzyme [Psychromonas sp. CNPT3]|uniref:bifunctional tRNA (5-methylaminomethyl-2-thiouridine)(34)-methyltransferase MnmD/FAD-dependent 5-carboxymethylaminomethyl-2-thiouridine(34) oxidoreductase MnmC n=1 Tax=Psychromonas sp. CNPT3 TaxID=314282 RepID=UPI00006E80E4|nr:bifunctional tRNA (5-methylaminomethyl-2-thiouridine)(34)-methyltransferase MnmD/FAD-dependent 5-carboxymethylaminomethyl-2-thiouridine(34) oxidoreductase MnmC [Psychromonas sp. CNPT3]AGH81117.1 bifunctional 5-methylaminomethyl-2-thiouridine-forming enzyme methyltransferase/FAD-dependent demodification enzyme [Psychromonas sp. CNPT3]
MSEGKNTLIKHAQIHWSDQQEPFSPHFDDVYFNTDQGIDESTYVFLQGNDLISRWEISTQSHFCIAETGFGSGLNFLISCLYFQTFLDKNPKSPLKHLFFSSFEKYPLSKSDLTKALQRWPTLSDFIQPLIKQYPLALSGCHRIHFKNITLDLWLGDVKSQLPTLCIAPSGLFDCWYLDGFSPLKNPDMWDSELFHLIANSCKDKATLATFTAAGFVRRSLQDAGFIMRKRKGYGKKREMLIGEYQRPSLTSNQHPAWHVNAQIDKKEVAIVGGGISSACLTLALVRRGYHVTLYCQDETLGCGASGNAQGALYPLLNHSHNSLSQLFSNAFLYARNYVENIHKNNPIDHDFNGLLQLYYDKQASTKLEKIRNANLPEELVHYVDAKKTNNIAALKIDQDALFYPLGGWLSPKQLVNAIFKQACSQGNVTIKLQHKLQSFTKKDNSWQLHFTHKTTSHPLLILACAMQTLDFKQCFALPFSAARGQVTHIDPTEKLKNLRVTLCHAGYLTPANGQKHCMGATFKRHQNNVNFMASEQQENKKKLEKSLRQKSWIKAINIDHKEAHVGIRCTTRDHFPYVGSIANYSLTRELNENKAQDHKIKSAKPHENLFILSGLGSRGLVSAPILSELLASQINAEPLPLSLKILESMQIDRQWLSYLRKGKKLKNEQKTNN